MLGKTHMAAGAAASLAILQPTTITGCICAVAGGVLGGWICDIDLWSEPFSSDDDNDELDEESLEPQENERAQLVVLALFITALCFGLDYFSGGGLCQYMLSNLGIPMAIAGAVFIGACIYGIASKHRTFTHSILGCCVLAGSLAFICAPLTLPFAIGHASHVVLDTLNKRKVRILWPLKPGIRLGICASNGKANLLIGAFSLIACLILLPTLLTPNLNNSENVARLLEASGDPSAVFTELGLTNFQMYLIGINILTFFVYIIDCIVWSLKDEDSAEANENFVHTLLLIFPAAGGALGMLLAVLLGTGGKIVRGEDGNINFYTFSICFSLAWVAIYFIVANPLGTSSNTSETIIAIRNSGLIPLAFVGINVLTFIIYFIDGARRKEVDAIEGFEFLIALLGGATGGFLAMTITRKKTNTPQFQYGIPVMIAIHFILLAVASYNGYI